MNGLKLRTEACRTLAFGSIVAGYTLVGSNVTNPSQIIYLQNLTDALLWFSFDGIVDHFPLPAGGFLLTDICTNKDNTQGYFLQANTGLYVKRLGIPTAGSVYFTTFYSR
jgi:hypothetical protein